MILFTHRTNARSRSLRLSLDKEGNVIVTTPRFTPQFVIRRFVNSQEDWITQHQAKIFSARKALDISKDKVLVFGKPYKIEVKFSSEEKMGVRRVEDTLIVNPVANSATSIKTALDRFLKNLGSTFILKQAETLGKKMNTTYQHVSFKTQKTRWGSCSSQGNLNFNWRLVHSPPEVIKYVIIHELAHRTHMNHSNAFWGLVAKFDPEYRKHQGWLKRHGMAVND